MFAPPDHRLLVAILSSEIVAIYGQEPAGPRTCRGGEPFAVTGWLVGGLLAGGDPQRGCGAVGGGVTSLTTSMPDAR
jgi:hypothetical protein